jgi:hypothetical protein
MKGLANTVSSPEREWRTGRDFFQGKKLLDNSG